MRRGFWSKIVDCLIFPRGFYKVYNMFFILACMILVYIFVYITGGTKYVYSHTMYIPIILASVSSGVKGGLIIGLIAGILLGPLMPLDTKTKETQEFLNWFYRLIVFLFVGLISGVAFNEFRKKTKQIINLVTHNQETKIPSINLLNSDLLYNKIDLTKIKYLVSLVINNHYNIINLFNRKYYIELVKGLYERVKELLPSESLIFQSETNRFWLCLTCSDINSFVDRLLQSINQNFYINNIPVYVEISFGIAKYEQENIFKIFKNADTASLYANKLNLQYLEYNSELNKNSKNIELLGMFREALDSELLELYYQPKIDLKTNKPIGFEALLRWKHPEKGWISPGQIIPLVEETQLINPLTEWIFRRSLQTLTKLNDKNMSISINISAKNIHNPHFLKTIKLIMEEYNIDPRNVELELTESTIMENLSFSIELLQSLRNNHIQLSIDDFGTGYSSLAYLNQLPINIVKIDRSFISNIVEDEGAKSIVNSVINLVHKLGMKVVAEGVETYEIGQLLLNMNCDIAQGYFYAKPMSEESLFTWLQKNNSK